MLADFIFEVQVTYHHNAISNSDSGSRILKRLLA